MDFWTECVGFWVATSHATCHLGHKIYLEAAVKASMYTNVANVLKIIVWQHMLRKQVAFDASYDQVVLDGNHQRRAVPQFQF